MILVAILATIIGIVVTDVLHEADTFWARRIGRLPIRYANLPVGGVLALLAGLLLPAIAGPALVVAISFTTAALTWAVVDPIQP